MKVGSIILALFITAGLASSGFAIDADDIVPISAQKEKSMGMNLAKQVEEKYEAVSDPVIQKRFEEIGKRLAAVCDRQEFIYHFKVLKPKEGDDKEKYYNAFTLPGGYVYIFEPLMEIMKTDDKIAAITAHEIGHTSLRHVVKRLQGSIGINAIMLLALVAAREGSAVAEANEALVQLMMSYSREDELDADKISIKYLKEAKFNPNGALDSLLTLQKFRKEGPEMVYMYYRSHPYLSERIAMVRAEIKGYADFDSYINLPKDAGSID